MRFNDSAIDSRGRLWSATMREDEDMDGVPRGSLRLLSEGTLPNLLGGLTAGNGIAWAPDNKYMYLADSGPNHVLRMPFDAGSAEIGAPEIWLEPGEGSVDGIVGDLAGGLWICLWGAGEMHRYDRNGRHVAVIRVGGASQVTAACFAGEDLQTMIITTSRRETPPGQHHGAVFRATVPIPGRPPTYWRGN